MKQRKAQLLSWGKKKKKKKAHKKAEKAVKTEWDSVKAMVGLGLGEGIIQG